jgi:hypothetical protein
MRPLQIIVIAFALFFSEGCVSTVLDKGAYTSGYAGIAGEKLNFSQESGKFEYAYRTELGIRNYSFGTWKQHKKMIFLDGLADSNINVINVESKVEDDLNETRDKIEIQYKDEPLDTFTKVDIIVNESTGVRIPGDTAYFTDAVTRTLQVKSYLFHDGVLFGTPPRLDTLFSPLITIPNTGKHKRILLKFNVEHHDFYRVRLTDTLTVKNRRTLVWGKRIFKKLRS